MVGRKTGIGCTSFGHKGIAVRVNNYAAPAVPAAGSLHHANVMHQQGAGIMQPVLGCNRIGQQPPANDLLTDQRHHHGMFDIVIERVGIADALQHQARRTTHIGRILGIAMRKILQVQFGHIVTEPVSHDRNGI